MSSASSTEQTSSAAGASWLRRLLAVVPILIAVGAVSMFASQGEEVSALTEPTDDLVNYETPHVYPIDLTPDASTLLAVNTAAHRLEVFDVASGTPVLQQSIPVGLDPVSVRARTNNEVWVVNHLSDSVSIVDLGQGVVTETLQTDNEPADVVFANNRAFVTASEANAINVFDLANLSANPQTISIAGEDPRALAVSEDGTTVYAAIFESGNGTTALAGGQSVSARNVVSRLEGPYRGQNPPPNDGNSFNPPLNPAIGNPPGTALIVRKDDAGNWMDDNGGNWSRFVSGDLASLTVRVPGWDLADNDVAVIDTSTLGISYRSRLMNINMALAVNPATDDITVVGTEARNEIRFEPNLNGNFVTVMLANLGANSGQAINDLNPHLDYSTPTVPPSVRQLSIGDPRGIAWNAAGTRAFVTGMGSNNVVVSAADGSRIGQFDVGQGPTGIVLGAAGRGFVMNKFAGSISVIDTAALAELAEVPFFDPTPQVIKDGRPVMYDTHLTSGTGHLSCASCHVDSRTDRLAWDLGNPSGSLDQVARLDGQGRPISGTQTVSPMKGPMLTQSLQDIMDFPTMHWRGDRANIGEFNPTFVNLMGRPVEVSPTQMTQLGDFLGTIHFPPNPYREIDGTRPATVVLPNGASATTQTFNSLRGSNSRGNTCLSCHYRENERNSGSNNELGQAFVPPSWIPWYDRLGYWPESANGSTTGFGYFHDGADSIGGAARTTNAERQSDMLAEIMTLEGPSSGLVGGERRQDTHAGVGQQVTITGPPSAAESARLNQLLAIDNSSSFAAMIVKTADGAAPRGFVHLGSGTFGPDRAADPNLSTAQLLAQAQAGNSVTFTLVAAGTQQRLGVDIDADGTLDGDEDPIVVPPGTISGTVTAADGSPVGGVNVDLFEQTNAGDRGAFLGNSTSGSNGAYQFEVTPGCNVLVFRAPEGQSFNGGEFLQQGTCVESGETSTVSGTLDEVDPVAASIGGSVTTDAGSGVAGVNVDRFAVNADGSRAQYLGSAATDTNGLYTFSDVLPVCYVIIFTAPTGQAFNGGQWLEVNRCVGIGEQVNDVNAVLDAAGEASIGGFITNADGSPAVGVGVDLFEQGENIGVRGQWLGNTDTDGSGQYSFPAEPGCYIMTMIAPAGETFNDRPWLQVPGCVAAGETVDTLNGVLDPAVEASLSGRVLFADGSGVETAQVDFFASNADGSRGTYIGTVFSDSTGTYARGVTAGCYWLVFVAPDGEQFTSGGQFFERFRCLDPGEAATDLNATLQ
ncbi:MAG: beta-propeller fold lactonase family protein [Acidimicrobiales bacterium]